MKRIIMTVALVLAAVRASAVETEAGKTWRETLRRELPLLGHRNWIVIADSAYPWQTAAGVETVATESDQLEVLDVVLDLLAAAKHVKPTVYVDKEMAHVAEADAPGIGEYRAQVKKRLGDRSVRTEPHEEIIKKLDAAGQTFHVLLLKTRMTLPYTSVFLQLECGYWNEAAEQRLRGALRSADAKTTGR